MQTRRRIRPVHHCLAVVLMTLVVVSGCAVPGYNERDAMLFEDNLHSEFKAGTFVPSNDHFDGGAGVGLRVSYEYEYGMHFGFEVTSIDDVEGAPYTGGALAGPAAIRGVGEKALDFSDRRTFTINFDWDVPLSQDGSLPYIRYGVGFGGLYTKNHLSPDFLAAVESGSPGSVVSVTDQLMFLVSPGASLRWNMGSDALTFVAEAQYHVASHDLIIDVDNDGDKAGKVDFGGLGAFVGFDYSF